jgi:hypothetical protein
MWDAARLSARSGKLKARNGALSLATRRLQRFRS